MQLKKAEPSTQMFISSWINVSLSMTVAALKLTSGDVIVKHEYNGPMLASLDLSLNKKDRYGE